MTIKDEKGTIVIEEEFKYQVPIVGDINIPDPVSTVEFKYPDAPSIKDLVENLGIDPQDIYQEMNDPDNTQFGFDEEKSVLKYKIFVNDEEVPPDTA